MNRRLSESSRSLNVTEILEPTGWASYSQNMRIFPLSQEGQSSRDCYLSNQRPAQHGYADRALPLKVPYHTTYGARTSLQPSENWRIVAYGKAFRRRV